MMLPLSTIEGQETEEVQTRPPEKGGETRETVGRREWGGPQGTGDGEAWTPHQRSPLALPGRDRQDAASLTSPPVSRSQPCSEPAGSSWELSPFGPLFVPRTP